MKAFDLEQLIKDHVNKEANEEWAHKNDRPQLPKFEKSKIIKNNSGWINFFLQLRP